MSEPIGGVVTGAKIAVFMLALIYSYLAHLSMDDFDFGWIGATAAAFALISLSEFLVILEEQTSAALFTWLVNLKGQVLFNDFVFLVAGLTTFMFLRSVKEDAA